MRGYVERQEWLQKSGSAHATYREVTDSMRSTGTSDTQTDMNRTLFGACGNEGCLDCVPAYIVEFDDGERQYPVTFTYRKEREDG